MYHVQHQPLLWLVEVVVCATVLCMLQLVAGLCTLAIANLQTTYLRKFAILLLTYATLSLLSMRVFDMHTHLFGTLLTALSMAFTTPLQASAYLHRTHVQRYGDGKSDGGDSDGGDSDGGDSDGGATWKAHTALPVRSTLLRIAVPASQPSATQPGEPPGVQAVRAVLYIAVVSLCPPYLDAVMRRGGVVLDAFALVLLSCGANGALNLTSAILGFLDSPCARPFRDPFLSRTMGEFWGGRWNVPVSHALRDGVYRPLVYCGMSRPVAVLTCFVVSGVSHELILMFAGIYDSHGEWMMFFFLCGVLTVVEKGILSRIRKPVFVDWTISAVVLYSLFHSLFVPVTVRTGLARRGVDSLASGKVFCSTLLHRLID